MRLTSRYSCTLPAPDSDSTSLSSTTAGMSMITCAFFASSTTEALPVASSARRSSAAIAGAPGALTKIDVNVYVAAPRRWNPHAASGTDNASAIVRSDSATMNALLEHDIDEPSGDHDDLPDRCAAAMARDLRRLPRRRFDRRLVGAGGHDELAAQLAVHLQHELDFVARERRLVDGRPRGIDQVAVRVSEPQLAPEHPGRVRHDRIEHAQQDRQSFARQRGRARRHVFERIEHLHAGGDDGVVLDAFIVVIGLLQRQMQLAAR